MRRRAAYIEFTIRECQEAIQLELVQIRKRFIDAANTLLDDGSAVVSAADFPPGKYPTDNWRELPWE